MTIQLQVCAECGAAQYPERDLCRACLADALDYRPDSGRGHLLAEALLHHTLNPALATQLPMRLGAVALDAGVRVIAFVAPGTMAGDTVVLCASAQGAQSLFIAHKEQSE